MVQARPSFIRQQPHLKCLSIQGTMNKITNTKSQRTFKTGKLGIYEVLSGRFDHTGIEHGNHLCLFVICLKSGRLHLKHLYNKYLYIDKKVLTFYQMSSIHNINFTEFGTRWHRVIIRVQNRQNITACTSRKYLECIIPPRIFQDYYLTRFYPRLPLRCCRFCQSISYLTLENSIFFCMQDIFLQVMCPYLKVIILTISQQY